MTDNVNVRTLVDADLPEAALIHRGVLDMEFLSRLGPAFMRAYYQAWIEAPGSISLAALDDDGHLLGALLGASDPATHVRAMVRHRGLGLGIKLVTYASVHPRLAKDLVVTRGLRYARGLTRLLVTRHARSSKPQAQRAESVVGEITHVLVRPDAQGRGVGRALLDAAVSAARFAGVQEIVLVTPPELGARYFYESLGWRSEGAVKSRSGEDFLRFRFIVRDGGPSDPDPSMGDTSFH
jgi:GNAT superfamily N-acetyltransferase